MSVCVCVVHTHLINYTNGETKQTLLNQKNAHVDTLTNNEKGLHC